MINRPKAIWVGGDYIKLEKVSEGLRKLGVEVDISEKPLITPAILMRQYDIVHTWNFSMEWSKFAIWAGVKWKKKVVATMIYHDTDKFISYPHQQIMLDNLDAAIYETHTEIERVKRNLTPKENAYIVPNGVDTWWFEPTDVIPPVKGYVLTVGRIERSKGQLETAKACKELGIPYVCIGERTDNDYAIMCSMEGAMIYPSMTQEDLKPWYKHCKCYVQASFTETWGMAVDEAGTQGVPLVLSTGFERLDVLDAVYCKHEDTQSIKDAITTARPAINFQQALKKTTWEEVSKAYKEIYEKII